MKKRIKFIDIARGIAMLLVVMGHCDNFKLWSIEKFSALFFMQLFIFISGIFYQNEIHSVKESFTVIKKKCLPIYIYYLKFELLFYVLTNVFIKIGFYSTTISYGGKYIGYITSFKDLFIGIIKIVFLMGREPFCGAFWFLITLMFVSIGYTIITYISNKLNKEKKSVIINILVGLSFLIGCIMKYTYSIPRISPAFTLILFFYLGKLYGNDLNRIKFNNFWIFLISIISLNVLYFFGNVSMNNNSFKDPIYLLICSFCGIYLVMYISKIIEEKTNYICNCLMFIGQNTLPILALHFVSFKLVMSIQLLIGQISFEELGLLKGANNNNLIYIFYILCGLTIPLIYEFLKKEFFKKG